MRPLSRQIAWMVPAALACTLPLRADEAEQAFQTLYAKDLQRVQATADRADDVALAKQMIEAAKSAVGQPKFLALLCERACALAGTHPGGYQTAVESMNYLTQAVPEKRLACLKKKLDLHQRRYNGARGDTRIAAANALIGCLTDLVDEAAAREDYTNAIAYVRRASYLAVATRLGAKDALQGRLKQVLALDRVAKLIGSVRDRLKVNPKDTTSRERLIRLYLVERDDPNAAAKYLNAECSQVLQTYVPLAAKEAESLADTACLELGDWYLDLAERASEQAKPAMMCRAETCYRAFLVKHTGSDLSVTRARIALKKIEDQLAKLSPSRRVVGTRSEPTGGAKPGGAISALALVTQPAQIQGVRCWTIETPRPRGGLSAVAYTPDGKHLAVAGRCGTVWILTAATGKLVRILVGHDGPIHDLAYSPEGSMLASASADRTIRLWRVETGRCLAVMKGHTGTVNAVTWSPTGKALASGGSDGMLGLWRAQSGRLRALLQAGGPVCQVAWSRNAKMLVTVSDWMGDRRITLWNAASGRAVPLPVPRGVRGSSTGAAAAWSPDSKMVALAGKPGTVELRNLRTGRTARTLKALDARAVALAWSPDGKLLAANERRRGEAGTLRLWDTRTWEFVAALEAPGTVSFADFAWSGDSRSVATVGSDGAVKLWEVPSGKGLLTVRGGKGESFGALAWSPDGKALACGAAKSVWLWRLTGDNILDTAGGYENAGGVNALAWSPDSRLLATGAHDGVRILDANSAAAASTIPRPGKGRVLAVAWSLDGGMLAYATGSTVRLVAAQTWKHVVDMKQKRGAHAGWGSPAGVLRFSPDARLLACGLQSDYDSYGGTLWRVPAGQRAQSLDHGGARVLSLAWHPGGGWLASGTHEGKVRIWEAASGQLRKTIRGPAGWQVHALAWSPDGKTLAVAGAALVVRDRDAWTDWNRPGPIRLLNVEAARFTRTLRGHAGGVHSLAWSRDGKTLASGGPYLVRLWDAGTHLARTTFLSLGTSAGLAVSREGHFRASDVVQSGKDLIYVADTLRGQETFTPAEFATRYGWKNDPARLRSTTQPAGR